MFQDKIKTFFFFRRVWQWLRLDKVGVVKIKKKTEKETLFIRTEDTREKQTLTQIKCLLKKMAAVCLMKTDRR